MNEGERVAYDDSDKWCQGPCMAGARRRQRAYQQAMEAYQAELADYQERLADPDADPGEAPVAPVPPRFIPILGDPIFDQGCTWDVKSKLSRLDGMAAIAVRESDGMRGATGEPVVSRTPGHTSPSPTIEDLEDLEGWLRSWKAAVLGVDELARLGGLMDAITFGTAWLAPRVERILRHPDLAVPFAEELLAWYARLDRWDPTDVTVQRMPLRCPSCKRYTLERRAGEDAVRCRAADCTRGTITMAEYQGMVDQQAGAARVAARAQQKARADAKTPRPPVDYGTLSGRA
ncbi:hypothetical protein [Microbispora sp. CA-102843]|uniref:hypothetical protein n=1 Tax=Microbispora sp. CA-102843 TaxID=3239952 RepID=UPI003D92F8AA